MRILYVEDNPANISLLQRIARMGGHDVVYYNDGEVALSHFEQDKPDLILMDLQLAGALNGLDVVRKLRSEGVATPIIAVTAYAMVGDKERCMEAGCDGYLAKPLPVADLVETVQKYEQALKDKEIEKAEAAVPVEAKADTVIMSRKEEPLEDVTEAERSKVLRTTSPLPDLAKKVAARKAAKEKKEAKTTQAPAPAAAVENKADGKAEPAAAAKTKPEETQMTGKASASAGAVENKADGKAEPAAAAKAKPETETQTTGKAPEPATVTKLEAHSPHTEETLRIAAAPVKTENGKKD